MQRYMIYTVTFNPALDYVVAVEHFTLGSVNRTIRENIFYGGKGINVSALLANLGYRSTALGFIAGFTGREIERGVRSLGFDSDFIQVEKGMSRINVKLKSDQESEINGMGPEITDGDVEQLFQKLSYLKGMCWSFREAYRLPLTMTSTRESWNTWTAGESAWQWMRRRICSKRSYSTIRSSLNLTTMNWDRCSVRSLRQKRKSFSMPGSLRNRER